MAALEKKRLGRPPKDPSDKKVRSTFTLSPDVFAALVKTENASGTIDDLVRRYLLPETLHNPPRDL
jgi:hypothetical protein